MPRPDCQSDLWNRRRRRAQGDDRPGIRPGPGERSAAAQHDRQDPGLRHRRGRERAGRRSRRSRTTTISTRPAPCMAVSRPRCSTAAWGSPSSRPWSKGIGSTTLEIKISFVRPITPETGLIRAEGTVLNCGRRVGIGRRAGHRQQGPAARPWHDDLPDFRRLSVRAGCAIPSPGGETAWRSSAGCPGWRHSRRLQGIVPAARPRGGRHARRRPGAGGPGRWRARPGLPLAGLYGSMLPLAGRSPVRQLAPGRGRAHFGDGGHRRGRRGAAGDGRSRSDGDALRDARRDGGCAVPPGRPAASRLRCQLPVEARDRGLHARRRARDHRLAIAQGAGRPRRGRDHAGAVREPLAAPRRHQPGRSGDRCRELRRDPAQPPLRAARARRGGGTCGLAAGRGAARPRPLRHRQPDVGREPGPADQRQRFAHRRRRGGRRAHAGHRLSPPSSSLSSCCG